MPDPVTVSLSIGTLAGAWKLLGALYDKYSTWSVRRQRSAEAEQMKARALELMRKIHWAILSGRSSDNPDVAPDVRELRALLSKGVRVDTRFTEDLIDRGRGTAAKKHPAKKKAPAKKRAAKKKAPAKKRAAKKPVAKKRAPARKRA